MAERSQPTARIVNRRRFLKFVGAGVGLSAVAAVNGGLRRMSPTYRSRVDNQVGSALSGITNNPDLKQIGAEVQSSLEGVVNELNDQMPGLADEAKSKTGTVDNKQDDLPQIGTKINESEESNTPLQGCGTETVDGVKSNLPPCGGNIEVNGTSMHYEGSEGVAKAGEIVKLSGDSVAKDKDGKVVEIPVEYETALKYMSLAGDANKAGYTALLTSGQISEQFADNGAAFGRERKTGKVLFIVDGNNNSQPYMNNEGKYAEAEQEKDEGLYLWMNNHAAKYGFINRGLAYAWEYVGVEKAQGDK